MNRWAFTQRFISFVGWDGVYARLCTSCAHLSAFARIRISEERKQTRAEHRSLRGVPTVISESGATEFLGQSPAFRPNPSKPGSKGLPGRFVLLDPKEAMIGSRSVREVVPGQVPEESLAVRATDRFVPESVRHSVTAKTAQ